MNPETVLGGCECHERALLAVFRGVTACPCVPLQPQGQADDAQHRSSKGDAGEVPTLISLKLKPSCSVPLLQCSCRSWGLLKLTAPCPPQGAECPQKLGPARTCCQGGEWMQRCVTCRAPAASHQHHPVPGSAGQEPRQWSPHPTVPTRTRHLLQGR